MNNTNNIHRANMKYPIYLCAFLIRENDQSCIFCPLDDIFCSKMLLYYLSQISQEVFMKVAQQKEFALIFVMVLIVTFFGIGIVDGAGQKAIRKFPIPEHGTLELNVPISWKVEVHKPQEKMPPTLIFKPASGDDFQVLVTILWSNKGEPDFNSQSKVRAFVEKDGQNLLPNTVETKILLQEIKGVNNIGYYFSVTDKAPNPGEYRYMNRGAIGVGNLLLNATILHRVKESESVKDALSMLREARQSVK